MRKIAQFNHVRVYRDVEWNQYIVKDTPREATWYYTDDKQDALDTARKLGGVA